jgi:hypothetical protein
MFHDGFIKLTIVQQYGPSPEKPPRRAELWMIAARPAAVRSLDPPKIRIAPPAVQSESALYPTRRVHQPVPEGTNIHTFNDAQQLEQQQVMVMGRIIVTRSGPMTRHFAFMVAAAEVPLVVTTQQAFVLQRCYNNCFSCHHDDGTSTDGAVGGGSAVAAAK